MKKVKKQNKSKEWEMLVEKKHFSMKHQLEKIGMLLAAIVLEAAGVSYFFGATDPVLTPGGISGLAITLENLDFLPFGKGLIILMLNIPIILIGMIKFGPRFFAFTLVAIVGSSGMVELFDAIKPEGYVAEPLVGAIGGGVLIGIAVGLIMRAGATFGGTDIIVKLLRLKYKYMQTGTFYLFVDGVIVLFGTVCLMFENGTFVITNFNPDILVYSILAIFIQSYVSNLLLYGTEGARMVYIITTKEDVISKRINEELHSGVTYIKGKGAYTERERQVMLCAMRKQLLPKARDIVIKEDPEAFMIVTSANQVLGKGYKPLDEEDL